MCIHALACTTTFHNTWPTRRRFNSNIHMYNAGRNHHSHHGRGGFESHPSQVDTTISPNAPRHHPIPLPPRVWKNVPQPHIHPLLRYSYSSFISYDIRHPPFFAFALNTRLEWAHEPATNPSSPQMIITCYVLPRPFIVRPFGKHYDFMISWLPFIASLARPSGLQITDEQHWGRIGKN